MSPGTDLVVQTITQRAKLILDTDSFSRWSKSQSPRDRDLAILNNAFIYRKLLIRTSESPQYLCLKVENKQPDLSQILVTTPGDSDSDSKLFSARARNLPPTEPLGTALRNRMRQVGQDDPGALVQLAPSPPYAVQCC